MIGVKKVLIGLFQSVMCFTPQRFGWLNDVTTSSQNQQEFSSAEMLCGLKHLKQLEKSD